MPLSKLTSLRATARPRAWAGAAALARRRMHVGLRESTRGPAALAAQQSNLRTQGVAPLSLNAPVFQVFGANTDVGKTIVSAGICRGAVRSSSSANTSADRRVAYIKPLQTGTDPAVPDSFQGDAPFVAKHAQAGGGARVDCSTLYTWKTPVSPHTAARLEGHSISDEALLDTLTARLESISARQETDPHALVLVETAGGVCSPSASMRFQVDVYRGLRLPVVLVGDGKLGGISTTMSALETLLIRGYDVAAVCLIEQDALDNAEALEPRVSELGIPLFTMQAVPPMPEPLDEWFDTHDATFAEVSAALETFHARRLDAFRHMQARAEHVFWWPFTQHKQYGRLSMIDAAHGDEFAIYRPEKNAVEPMFDACASWWTQGVGHGNHKMATAMAYAAGRYGHVMFPENAHEPALQLSEKLLASVGKGWASRVYFSDDGSTAVEVAIKMAFRKYVTDHGLDYRSFSQEAAQEKLVVLAQANCYHGDTLGVMNVAEPSVFNEKQHPWYRPEAAFLKTPSLSLRDGQYVVSADAEVGAVRETLPSLDAAFHASRDASPLADVYRAYVASMIAQAEAGAKVGALLIEPVLVGSGGMILVDPLFQRVAVRECRARGIPVIFDEVFSGWWRLGVESARDLLGENPDIACYAKLLTGGVVPLAVTLASEDVFQAFYADGKDEALLHGHSFTAHPVGCAAAVTALDMYQIFNDAAADKALAGEQGGDSTARNRTRAYWDADALAELSRQPFVARAFAIGTVACMELESADRGYASGEARALIQQLRTKGVYARALGNVVYLMCSPLTTRADCDRYLSAVTRELVAMHTRE